MCREGKSKSTSILSLLALAVHYIKKGRVSKNTVNGKANFSTAATKSNVLYVLSRGDRGGGIGEELAHRWRKLEMSQGITKQ